VSEYEVQEAQDLQESLHIALGGLQECHRGVTGVSQVLQVCCRSVSGMGTWVSQECDRNVTGVSHGCHMDVTGM
jgi:hypothetical protein